MNHPSDHTTVLLFPLTDHELTVLMFIGTQDKECLDHCDLATLSALVNKDVIQCDSIDPVTFSLTELGCHCLPATTQPQAS